MHKRLLAFGLAWLAAAGGPASGIAADSPDGHTAEEVLAAMDRTSTWGHPDQYNEFAGMHCYTRGDYPCALSRFREAARYADKLSQLSIGLMYLNGQGVDKDPVVAFAWVAIAAERRYPPFLATRDRLWANLDEKQRDRATELVARLYRQYGDATAKPRMTQVLRRQRARLTGSYLGFNQGVWSLPPDGRQRPCGPTIDGGPASGCGDLYADWRWNPEKYFRSRDAAWTGTVSVGPLEPVRGKPGRTPADGH